jgi:hypothetical protein
MFLYPSTGKRSETIKLSSDIRLSDRKLFF